MNSDPLSESRPRSGNGRSPYDLLQRLEAPSLGLVRHGPHLGPSRGHAGEVQGLAELPAGVASVVGDQVHLAEPGDPLVPLGEGPDGDLALEEAPGLGPRAAPDPEASALGRQQPVDRRRRDPQKLGPELRGDLQLAPPLHRLHDVAHERGQALAGWGVQRCPDPPERLQDVPSVGPGPSGSSALRGLFGRLAQGTPGVTATPPRERAQLVQDPALLGFRSSSVPLRHLLRHRLAFRHREPHRVPPEVADLRWSLTRSRTFLDEATKPFRGHFW